MWCDMINEAKLWESAFGCWKCRDSWDLLWRRSLRCKSDCVYSKLLVYRLHLGIDSFLLHTIASSLQSDELSRETLSSRHFVTHFSSCASFPLMKWSWDWVAECVVKLGIRTIYRRECSGAVYVQRVLKYTVSRLWDPQCMDIVLYNAEQGRLKRLTLHV